MTIQERCRFRTKRLSVSGWMNQQGDAKSKNKLAEEVIDILSPNVTKSLPSGWRNISSINMANKWIMDRDNECHFINIHLKSTLDLIGFIFLYEANIEDKSHELRFGYLLSEKVWGNGIGTELINGLIDWCKGEGNIKSISGGVEKENKSSIKVLEKTGFSLSSIDAQSPEVVFYEYQFDCATH